MAHIFYPPPPAFVGGNQPLVAKELNPSAEAVSVDNPPFNLAGKSPSQLPVLVSWLPPLPNPFEGGRQPLAANKYTQAPTVIHVCSTPSTFLAPAVVADTPTTVTFNIPAGNYASAVWDKTSDQSTGASITAGSGTANFPSGLSSSVNATALQIGYINANAGGTISVIYTDNNSLADENVTAFCITLTTSAPQPVPPNNVLVPLIFEKFVPGPWILYQPTTYLSRKIVQGLVVSVDNPPVRNLAPYQTIRASWNDWNKTPEPIFRQRYVPYGLSALADNPPVRNIVPYNAIRSSWDIPSPPVFYPKKIVQGQPFFLPYRSKRFWDILDKWYNQEENELVQPFMVQPIPTVRFLQAFSVLDNLQGFSE